MTKGRSRKAEVKPATSSGITVAVTTDSSQQAPSTSAVQSIPQERGHEKTVVSLDQSTPATSSGFTIAVTADPSQQAPSSSAAQHISQDSGHEKTVVSMDQSTDPQPRPVHGPHLSSVSPLEITEEEPLSQDPDQANDEDASPFVLATAAGTPDNKTPSSNQQNPLIVGQCDPHNRIIDSDEDIIASAQKVLRLRDDSAETPPTLSPSMKKAARKKKKKAKTAQFTQKKKKKTSSSPAKGNPH